MPELPEVEVTRQGIEPHVSGQKILAVLVHQPRLRWPIPANLPDKLLGRTVFRVARRGKYLLFDCGNGWLIIHLGMSGTLRRVETSSIRQLHDHFEIVFSKYCLRLNDPRRFGAVLWHDNEAGDVLQHPLLKKLGVEPLDYEDDLGKLMYQASRGRTLSIKQMLLAGEVVVGVGNIYASESLFGAAIKPTTQAGKISLVRYQKLAESIRSVLFAAVEKGGSTLRDFYSSDGVPGYFQLEAQVYGRQGQACRVCGAEIKLIKQGQRATYYCAVCQSR